MLGKGLWAQPTCSFLCLPERKGPKERAPHHLPTSGGFPVLLKTARRCGTRSPVANSDSPRAIPENPAVLGNTKGVNLHQAFI